MWWLNVISFLFGCGGSHTLLCSFRITRAVLTWVSLWEKYFYVEQKLNRSPGFGAGEKPRKGWDSPVQTRFRHRPFLKSWNTRLRCSWAEIKVNLDDRFTGENWIKPTDVNLNTVLQSVDLSMKFRFSFKKGKTIKAASILGSSLFWGSFPADLSHLGMNVETWITKLGDLLGKKLYSLRGVAEDDRLVDLELKKH